MVQLQACSTGPPARPPCPTWADHDWSPGRIVATGRHPVAGRFETVAVRCERCGRERTETRWLRLYGTLPALEDET